MRLAKIHGVGTPVHFLMEELKIQIAKDVHTEKCEQLWPFLLLTKIYLKMEKKDTDGFPTLQMRIGVESLKSNMCLEYQAIKNRIGA